MDKYDIPDLLDRVKHLMPFHSETKVSVPHSYEMRFPKDLMEESHKVQNKFLNDSLGEIEEAYNKNILPSQFKTWFSHQIHNYQIHKLIVSECLILNGLGDTSMIKWQ